MFFLILSLFIRLGEEYQTITDKALGIPKTTAELMDLIAYVNEVETVTLYQMEERLREVLKYMLFLSDHALFTPVEMKQNNMTFWWYVLLYYTFSYCVYSWG